MTPQEHAQLLRELSCKVFTDDLVFDTDDLVFDAELSARARAAAEEIEAREKPPTNEELMDRLFISPKTKAEAGE